MEDRVGMEPGGGSVTPQAPKAKVKPPKGKPRGRMPTGMTWCSQKMAWVPAAGAVKRFKPYVAIKDRKMPAPQGRPFKGTKWCHTTERYVLKTPHPDAGKATFKLDVPHLASQSQTEWSTRAPAPEANP